MAHEDGPKQRKSKLPVSRAARRAERKAAEGVPEPTPQTVNERQIATGTLATSGDRGADMIARVSDFIQANGRVMVSLVAVVMVALVAVLWYSRSTSGQVNVFQARIVLAESETKVKDLLKAFDRIAPDVESNAQFAADFHYRLGVRLAEILAQDITWGRKFDEDGLARLRKAVADYGTASAEDSAAEFRKTRLDGLMARIDAHDAFIRSEASRAFNDTEYKPENPKPAIVADGEPPVAVFETTAGKFRLAFHDDVALRNSVNLAVTLVERGFYEGVQPSLILNPGFKKLDDPLFANVSLVGFGDRGKLYDLPKEEDKDKKLTDEEKKEREKKRVQQPYFTIQPEVSSLYSNEEGAVMLYYEASQSFRRGTYLAVNLKDNLQLDGKYQVIGKAADADSLKVLRSLLRTDRILNAWMESKRDRDYTPRVIFTQGPQASALPTLWLEKPGEVEPIRIPKTEVVIDDAKNPLVVISTDKGDVEFELDEDICPNTVANFIYLIEKDGYRESAFHRVEGVGTSPDSTGLRIVQGGRDPANVRSAKEKNDLAKDKKDQARRASSSDADRLNKEASDLESEAGTLQEEFGWTIKNEAVDRDEYNLKNTIGTIAMARQTDVHSAGRQFFVNLKDNPDWDRKDSPYCVFGTATKNLWVLHNIRKDDKILEIRVVRKRSHAYVPEIKAKGEINYKKAG